MVRHEMNLPMQVILGHADFLSMDLPEEAPQKRRIETIQEQIKKMSDITRKLTSITKTRPYLGKSKIINLEQAAGGSAETAD